ncbi:MAG: Chanoclavine-I aldehyde reductase fgaOx3 [Icmadophila ericetorum]|nr:Chanoclavine-I aldehyde reductase fgaOx3 [Icmadophila ericetorum]
MPALSDPLHIGKMALKHRLVMAPLTRFRANDDHVPLPMVTEYYTQRASVPGTLLITEATFISPRASGYANVPGIWSRDQIKQWKIVTDSVHSKGSYIYLQLWALGRTATPEVLKKETGLDLVSSSATPVDEKYQTPRAMSEEEIHEFIADYAQGAKNAIEAGFDGVEIHGANGYLIDQFTQDTCNKRTDKWGGSIENRARFGLEVAKAVVDAVGAERTGIRLSPFSTFQGMLMEDPHPQFSYLINGLKQLNLSYLHLVESRISGNANVESTYKLNPFLDLWSGTSPVLVAGGFKPDSAKRAVEEEYADHEIAVVFGRYFISNPDLPYRITKGIELEPYDRKTFYVPKSPEGYTTYPFSEEFQRDRESKI